MHLPEHFSEGVALLHREFRVCYATLVDAVHLEHLHVQDRHPGPILRSTAVHCTAPQHQHCTALRWCTMHCTAHTTRATRECASMHTRTWRGRARARTHLGTRAGAAPATRAHSSGRQPRTAGECSCRCPQHSAHDANNTRECASMHTRVMAWESTSVDAPRHTSCWRWPLDRAAEPRRRIRGRWISLARMNLQLQCPGHPRKNGIGAAVFG